MSAIQRSDGMTFLSSHAVSGDGCAPGIFHSQETGFFCATVRLSDDQVWVTEGETRDEALDLANSVIVEMAETLAGHQLIPAAGEAQPGDVMLELSPDFALKVMLRNAMFEEGVRVSDIAKARGVRPQAVFKIVDFSRASKLSSLMPLFEAVKRPLKISC